MVGLLMDAPSTFLRGGELGAASLREASAMGSLSISTSYLEVESAGEAERDHVQKLCSPRNKVNQRCKGQLLTRYTAGSINAKILVRNFSCVAVIGEYSNFARKR